MCLMKIEEMMSRKIELGLSNKALSDLSGVPVGTLQKIFSGETKTPRADTIRALEAILSDSHCRYDPAPTSLVFNDSGQAYKTDTDGYTIEDYLALPDDYRVELIDGVFYNMSAPTTLHQAISGYIYGEFLHFIRERGGSCFPFIAPVDVQLDRDNKTMLQPDVIIMCDRGKINRARVFGAPDFVLEVLSPSTRKKDMTLKLSKYSAAGVREYWIIDPEHKTLLQYDLVELDVPRIYSFNDKVPVLIWNSEFMIDLKDMWDICGFMADPD